MNTDGHPSYPGNNWISKAKPLVTGGYDGDGDPLVVGRGQAGNHLADVLPHLVHKAFWLRRAGVYLAVREHQDRVLALKVRCLAGQGGKLGHMLKLEVSLHLWYLPNATCKTKYGCYA